MPAFLFLLVMTLFGSTVLSLLVSLPGSHAFGVVLVSALTLGLAGLTWAFRPQSAPEGPRSVSPDYPLNPLLATLNADLWLMEGLRTCEGSQFYTLGSTPIWTKKCALPYCEHTAGAVCFCAEDCDCAFHTDARAQWDEFFGVWI